MPKEDDMVEFTHQLPKVLLFENVLKWQQPRPSPHNRSTFSIATKGEKINFENSFIISESEKSSEFENQFNFRDPDKLPDDRNSFEIHSVSEKLDFPSTFQNMPSETGPEYTLRTFPDFFNFYQPEILNFQNLFQFNKSELFNFPSFFDEKLTKDAFSEKLDIGNIFEFHDPKVFTFDDDFEQLKTSHCEKKDFESIFKFRTSKIWRWLETFLLAKPELRKEISQFLIHDPEKKNVHETFVQPEPLIHHVPVEFQINTVEKSEDF